MLDKGDKTFHTEMEKPKPKQVFTLTDNVSFTIRLQSSPLHTFPFLLLSIALLNLLDYLPPLAPPLQRTTVGPQNPQGLVPGTPEDT